MSLEFQKNVSLKNLSTFRIGGRVNLFYRVKDPDDLVRLIKKFRIEKKPFRVIALGSNVVFPDGKLKSALVQFSEGKIFVEGKKIISDAGVPLAQVIKKSTLLGLQGLETLSGIPGTVGGAVFGNAGAYGHSISEVVEKVWVLDPETGKTFWLRKKGCKFGYRESVFKSRSYLLLRVVLRFRKGNKPDLEKKSREIIKIRLKKYKPGLKCPGSFFKNVLVKDVSKKSLAKIDRRKIIEGKIPAGYLLEEVGARGMRFGGIKIADFHGNLFINRGNAKASDVKKIAALLKRRVYRRFSIKLEEEVRYF